LTIRDVHIYENEKTTSSFLFSQAEKVLKQCAEMLTQESPPSLNPIMKSTRFSLSW